MALFDKLKATAGEIKDKAVGFAEEKQFGETFGNAKEAMKKSLEKSMETMKESNRENKELKQALEGAIIRYEVVYIGGLPQYTKPKTGKAAIGLNIMQDKFVFTRTGNSKDWFEDFEIKYSDIMDITIEKRTISNAEMLLGGGNEANQQQENNICINFLSKDGKELMLRVEMLTGVSIYGQAGKCREFMDILRQNDILKQIKNNTVKEKSSEPDVFEQIEKLSKLKEAGILTEDEFNQKKNSLLEKI